MRLDCPRCGRVLEYTDKRPSFCAYCGKPLVQSLDLTAPHDPAEAATLPPCGPEAPRRCSVPDCIGGYRLVRSLGTGGMGTVYEAQEITTKRRVALKLIAPDYAGSEETVARFRQEGRLASQVVHPRCVFVHKADEEAGLPYIVMELMPGETLQDLVQKRGPLPVEEAVTKILDVIDGLQEAHRVGIIHRDVKPSNCFLETDGRVKIGDFGLSRSLVNDARLTRAGAFLGTPLYASPEQIRADPVDQQTDVYSVAATLYFLLTGRAPHQTGDAAATMARIVCEPAPSMRGTRPELSAALDGVVLQGLERDRGNRWARIEELRAALLPFAPGRLPAAPLAPRFAAFLADCILTQFVIVLVYLGYGWATMGNPFGVFDEYLEASVGLHLAGTFLWVAYFAVLEGRWGASVGKWLFGLSVCAANGCDPPGLARAFLRATVLEVLVFLVWYLDTFIYSAWLTPEEAGHLAYGWLGWALLGTILLGPFLPTLTMRRRNGYRGVHEVLSGTRVISVGAREPRLAVPSRRLEQEVRRPAGLPERLGPFLVLGSLREGPEEQVLLGQDPALGRKALIWLRGPGSAALSPERQELARGSRLRWLSGGCHADRPWDAFVAPAGCLLHDLIARHGSLSWADARPLLEQLTEELTWAGKGSELPTDLSADHVWVLPDERVCLLDFRLGTGNAPATSTGLAIVRQVALYTLEGRQANDEQTSGRVQAPLPERAARVLRRLVDPGQPYRDLDEWRDALVSLRDSPARVTSAARLAHLEFLALALAVGLFVTYVAPLFLFHERALRPIRASLVLEQVGPRLQAVARAEQPVAGLHPDRLLAAVLLAAHQEYSALHLSGRVREIATEGKLKHEARMRSLGWPLRKLVWLNSPSTEDVKVDQDFWTDYVESLDQHDESEEVTVLYILVTCFPLAWVVWAFLFRGGLSYRLSGLALVRGDGRPAARWQFGFRALLIWGPVAGLLGLSVWLDNWFVARFLAGDAPAWIPWLSWGSWWLAVLLPPAFALLALWRPERSLHDRLVGTYLVPR